MFLEVREKTALVWNNDNISYKELFENINKYSELYEGNNYEKVAIYSENRPEWIYAFYAAWNNNCINIPIDFMSTPDETAYILNDSDPDIIFCSKNNEKTLRKAIESVEKDYEVVILDDFQESVRQFKPKINNIDFPNFDNEQTAVIIYTSGTTGSPKGVMLSFGNLRSNIVSVSKDVPIFTDVDRTMALLPLHHILPLLGSIIAPLYTGGAVVFSKSLASQDVSAALMKGVSIVIGVPRFYSILAKGIKDKINKSFAARTLFALAKKINSESFSKKIFKKVHQKFGGKIKYLVCGGAKLDVEVIKTMKTLGFTVLEGFGMSEASPMITFPRPGFTKIGSVGQALPGCEIRFDDGELIAKGPNIMQGYYNKPEETAEALKDGWLRTGDLGEIDEDGHIFITGRRKEIIVLANGKNVNPVEVELKFSHISKYVNDIGVYLEDESLKAIIYPDFKKLKEDEVHDIQLSFENDIKNYNASVSPYKRIKKFTIVSDELPKTRIGKLKRFALPELAAQEAKINNQDSEPDYKEYLLIKNFLMKETNKEVWAKDHLEYDLGMDSLDMVGLLVYLNSTFGVEMNEETIAELGIVKKISEFIREKKIKIEEESVRWSAIFKDITDVKLPSSWFTHGIIMSIARIILKIYFRIKGEGYDNIPDGPVILAPNHQSFFDGLFVTIFMRNKMLKKTYFYAKEKHVRSKLIKFVAKTHNVIVMDLNKDLKQSIQKLAAALKKNRKIIIFPEGTRTKNGEIGAFKKTFAILSRELNVPIVPVAIKGAFDALPSGKKLPKPLKKISVKFLNPIYPENYSYDAIKEKVFEKVAASLKN